MHIVLTDLLTCPHCGPDEGLILLADRIEDRRVLDGLLGCARCGSRYPVAGGSADLRRGASDIASAHGPPPPVAGAAFRLAALMGVSSGSGFILLAGGAVAGAEEIAGLVEELEVVAVGTTPVDESEVAGVSRLAVGPRLPLRAGSMRAAALVGPAVELWMAEAVRVLDPAGRLVLDEMPDDAGDRVRALGLKVLAEEGRTLVAARG